MSILSVLGKIGKGALNVATGGVAGTVMDALGSAGTVAGGQQSGKNNALLAQGQLNQGNDRNAVDLYQAQQAAQNQAAQTDLQRKSFETGNHSATAKQALIGALLGGGVTPTSISGGQASGGLLRSLNGNPDAMAAMRALSSQGSAAQASPLSFSGGSMVAAPTLTPVPKIDTGDGVMGTMTKIAQIMGAVSPYLKKPNANGKPPSDSEEDS